MYIPYIYRIVVALLPRFTKDLHRLHPLLLPGVDFFLLEEVLLSSKLKPRATSRDELV